MGQAMDVGLFKARSFLSGNIKPLILYIVPGLRITLKA
jgi:hypothetical protein